MAESAILTTLTLATLECVASVAAGTTATFSTTSTTASATATTTPSARGGAAGLLPLALSVILLLDGSLVRESAAITTVALAVLEVVARGVALGPRSSLLRFVRVGESAVLATLALSLLPGKADSSATATSARSEFSGGGIGIMRESAVLATITLSLLEVEAYVASTTTRSSVETTKSTGVVFTLGGVRESAVLTTVALSLLEVEALVATSAGASVSSLAFTFSTTSLAFSTLASVRLLLAGCARGGSSSRSFGVLNNGERALASEDGQSAIVTIVEGLFRPVAFAEQFCEKNQAVGCTISFLDTDFITHPEASKRVLDLSSNLLGGVFLVDIITG